MTNSLTLNSRQFILCLILLLCGQTFTTKAQNQAYEMLWKISGKNLKQPSYLFGSIHVKDKKVFNFSDAVMRSIAKSSAFVLELDPDSMLTHLYDETKAGTMKVQLSDEQKAIVAKKYQEKHGLEADEKQLNNPLFISTVMRPDVENSDDMNTFLDAYLYGIAKTEGKKIFGLEKVEDQTETYLKDPEKLNELFDLDEDFSNIEFKKLVNLYAEGNLKGIENYVNDYLDETLNKRNLVMLNGILELLKKETLFVCVGIAHLPGENGLIELLKKQGYQVTLEPASYTGVARKYTINPKKFSWYKHETPEYSISFPSAPVTVNKTIEMRMTYLPDLMSGLSFGVISAYTPQRSSAPSLDTLAHFMADRSKSVISGKKNFLKNGIQTLEFATEKDGKKALSRVFHQNNYFYILTIEQIHKDTDSAYFNLFFDSFNSKKPASSAKWVVNKYDTEAYSISTPVAPQAHEVDTQDPASKRKVKVSMFVAPDFANNVNYIYRCSDFPEGYYMADRATAFNSIINQTGSKGEMVGEPRVIFKDGYEGRALDVIVSNTYMEFRTYFKGNRQYFMLRQNLSGPEKPADDEFFDSFQLLPYQNTKPTDFTVKNITNSWPGKPNPAPKENDDEEEDNTTHFLDIPLTYQHTNKNTGGMYMLEYSELSKYYRSPSVDSLYSFFANRLRSNMIDVAEKDFSIGAIHGKEIMGIDTLSGNMKKSRIWLQDKNMVLLQLTSTKDEVQSSIGQAFFNDIKTIGKPFSFDLKSSKADLIIKDLKSIDTTTQKQAKGALSFYNFDKDELPLLYQGIKHNYADDTTAYGTKGLLISQLKVLKDKTAIPLLKTTYQDIKNGDELRAKVLAEIPAIDSTQYDWYVNELQKANLKLKSNWILFEPLSDSLTYVTNHFEAFLTLLDRSDYRKSMLSIVSDLVEADSIPAYKELITKNVKSLTKYALADLEEDIELLKTPAYPNTAYQYLYVLPKLDKTLIDKFTNKIMGLADTIGYLKTRAVEVRIKQKLPIPKQVLAAQLDSLNSRHAIMLAFNEIGELDKVPAKYKEPTEFGKLLLHYYASEDYELKNINLLGEIEKENQIYYVYSFESVDDEDKIKYIGLAGAFDKNKKTIDFEKQLGYSNFEVLETDWKKQAKVLIEQLSED